MAKRSETNYNDNNKLSSTTSKSLSDLKAEMKLLHWHKLANESALQAALLRTKNLRSKEKRHKEDTLRYKNIKRRDNDRKEKERKRIVEEEQAKPLQVIKLLFCQNFTINFSCSQ